MNKRLEQSGAAARISRQEAGRISPLPGLEGNRQAILGLTLAVLAASGSGLAETGCGNTEFTVVDAAADSQEAETADAAKDAKRHDAAGDVGAPETSMEAGQTDAGADSGEASTGPAEAGKEAGLPDAAKDTNVSETATDAGKKDAGADVVTKDVNVQETSKEDGRVDSEAPDVGVDAAPSCDNTGTFEYDMNEYVYVEVNNSGSVTPFPESTQNGTYSAGKCGNSPSAGQFEGVWSPNGTIKFTSSTAPLSFKVRCSSYTAATPPTPSQLSSDLMLTTGWFDPDVSNVGTNYVISTSFCPSGTEFLMGFS
jgi:hypothetical protein